MVTEKNSQNTEQPLLLDSLSFCCFSDNHRITLTSKSESLLPATPLKSTHQNLNPIITLFDILLLKCALFPLCVFTLTAASNKLQAYSWWSLAGGH